MRNVDKIPIGLGVSSLMMMFLTVTLTSLMTLSIMTAYREKQLSKKSVDYIKAYYKADAVANIKKLEIMKQLQSYKGSMQLEDVLGQIDDIICCEGTDKVQINYSVPVLDTQILSVRLEVPFPYEKESEICVVGWYVRSTEEWEYEEEGFGEIIEP